MGANQPDPPGDPDFGALWRALRDRGLSWDKVGEAINRNGETVRLWSTGQGSPPAWSLVPLASLAGITIHAALGLPEPVPMPELSEGERILLRVLRARGIKPETVIDWTLSRPPSAAELDRDVRQIAAQPLVHSVDADAEIQTPAQRHDEHARPRRGGRGK